MAAEHLGPWDPMPLERLVERVADAPFRWWITGGHALELHLGQSWRAHDDTDLGIRRLDAPAVHRHFEGWDLHTAASGVLQRWDGSPLPDADGDHQVNNVWCRLDPNGPWVLDITVGAGDDEWWVYRRDRTLSRPWSGAVLRDPDGVAYLAPELQLLFKSKAPRAKDDLDAEIVIPELSADRRSFLARWLATGHPWRRWLD